MLLFLSGFLLLTVCAAQRRSPFDTKVLENQIDNSGLGPYFFRYALDDGSSHQQQGTIENSQYSTKEQNIVVRGSYSYTGPDNVVYTVTYTADENGFHPEGKHVKVPPFTPWPSKNIPLDLEREPPTGGTNTQTNTLIPGYDYTRPPPDKEFGESSDNDGVKVYPGYQYPRPEKPFEDLKTGGSEDNGVGGGYSYPKPSRNFVRSVPANTNYY